MVPQSLSRFGEPFSQADRYFRSLASFQVVSVSLGTLVGGTTS